MSYAGSPRVSREWTREELDNRPFIVIYEVTRACNLACVHCRAEAQPHPHPLELRTHEALRLLDEIAELQPATLVLTGGDPLLRTDLETLIRHAVAAGVRVAITPSATKRVTKAAIANLKAWGITQIAFSLDGASEAVHDDFRKVPGTFKRTLQALEWAREAGLHLQINTTVTTKTAAELPGIIKIAEELGIEIWSVFFAVPTGRAKLDTILSAAEHERIFTYLADMSQQVPFNIKATAAPAYRRVLLQRRTASIEGKLAVGRGRAPIPINDGLGFVFISHVGDVYPNGLFPLSVGNVRRDALADVYRHHPLMLSLRDPQQLRGKCGVCEFRTICGGSRARAYAVFGDPLASDPACAYIPPAYAARIGARIGQEQGGSGAGSEARPGSSNGHGGKLKSTTTQAQPVDTSGTQRKSAQATTQQQGTADQGVQPSGTQRKSTQATTGVMIMALGTPDGPHDIEAYYTRMRGGRTPAPALVNDLRQRYAAIGGQSPLLRHTRAQALGLQAALDRSEPGRYRVTLGMQHSRPFIEEEVKALAENGIQSIVGLVLTPQYSSLSVGVYSKRLNDAGKDLLPVSVIEHWHLEPGYLQFLETALRTTLKTMTRDHQISAGQIEVVFTAHSLPSRLMDTGDPYPEQVRETAEAIAQRTGLVHWSLAWQSAGRTGESWIGPTLLNVMAELPDRGRKGVIVCAVGFVSDHLEILYDLDIEARQAAQQRGLFFERTAMPNNDPVFLAALANVVHKHIASSYSSYS